MNQSQREQVHAIQQPVKCAEGGTAVVSQSQRQGALEGVMQALTDENRVTALGNTKTGLLARCASSWSDKLVKLV